MGKISPRKSIFITKMKPADLAICRRGGVFAILWECHPPWIKAKTEINDFSAANGRGCVGRLCMKKGARSENRASPKTAVGAKATHAGPKRPDDRRIPEQRQRRLKCIPYGKVLNGRILLARRGARMPLAQRFPLLRWRPFEGAAASSAQILKGLPEPAANFLISSEAGSSYTTVFRRCLISV